MTKRDKHHHIKPEFGLTVADVGWEREAQGFVDTWINVPQHVPTIDTAVETLADVTPADESETAGIDTFPCPECGESAPHSHIKYVQESDGKVWVSADAHQHSYGDGSGVC